MCILSTHTLVLCTKKALLLSKYSTYDLDYMIDLRGMGDCLYTIHIQQVESEALMQYSSHHLPRLKSPYPL